MPWSSNNSCITRVVGELVAAAGVTLVWTGPIAARGTIFHGDAAREPSPRIRTPTELDQTLAEARFKALEGPRSVMGLLGQDGPQPGGDLSVRESVEKVGGVLPLRGYQVGDRGVRCGSERLVLVTNAPEPTLWSAPRNMVA